MSLELEVKTSIRTVPGVKIVSLGSFGISYCPRCTVVGTRVFSLPLSLNITSVIMGLKGTYTKSEFFEVRIKKLKKYQNILFLSIFSNIFNIFQIK